MAKANITEYDSTAGNNTVINDIDISEGCSPSTINNAIRELMAHLKNVDTGSQALTALSVTGALSCGAFTSNGIDDNADALAITIDNSENVHIGKTSTGLSTAGLSLRGDADVAQFTRDGNAPLELNRLSSNGEILGFYKDSSLIGQISGTIGLIVGTGDTGLGFQTSTGDAIIPQRPDTQAGRDNAINLGNSSNRFNNLYLSGGVFIGGAGPGNKLDDYEEGTWTPEFVSGNAPSGTVSSLAGQYTKIGRTVYLQFQVSGSSLSIALYARLQGLPFSATNDSDTGTYVLGSIASRGHGWTTVAAGQTQLYLSQSGTTSSPSGINGSLVYRAS